MSAEFQTNDSELIQTIKDSVKTEEIHVEPGDYTTRPVFIVPDKPLVKRLNVASLTGLLDYINNKVDAGTRKEMFVHVDSPTEVVFSGVVDDREDRRFAPLTAIADTPTLTLDRYVSREEAMIMLQARFVATPERALLLEHLGNIVADEELDHADDGVTQTVTVMKGIRRSQTPIENPVRLRPFRTFTEVEQPESPFIVRVRKHGDEEIQVAFYEADGGAWRNAARQSIKAFLADGIANEFGYPVLA